MHPEVWLLAALLAATYVMAGRRMSTGLGRGRVVAFAAGLVAFVAAFTGPIHDLAERGVFSAHMVQHLLLTLAVPPCLLAGLPSPMLDAALAPLLRRRAGARLLAALTRPLPALVVWAAVLAAWHLPAPYAAALASPVWHVVQHTTLMAGAVLAWWPVVSPSRRLPALPYAGRILYLLAFGAPMTIVAALITGAEDVLYPMPGPLDDQRLGGVLMWVPAGLVPLIAFTVVFFTWAAAEPEDPDPPSTSPAYPK